MGLLNRYEEASSRLRPAERETLDRLRDRFPDRSFAVSEHEGAEVVDEEGRSYDFAGDPRAILYWNRSEFESSISDHLLKSNDHTVIDMTGFTRSQQEQISNYLDRLSPDQQAKIIRVGF